MNAKVTTPGILLIVKSIVIMAVLFCPRSAERTVWNKSFRIISHRGTAHTAPENTVPAFEGAIRENADMIEFDIRLTKDDFLVVMHDPTLDRTTDARDRWRARGIPVDSKKFDEIKTLDAGTGKGPGFRGTRVPSFTEAMEVIEKRSVALVHRKSGDAKHVAADIFRRGFKGKTVVQSEDLGFLRDLHTVAPDIPLGWIAGDSEFRRTDPESLRSAGIRIVAFDVKTVSADTLDIAMREGFSVFVYTIDRYADGVRMARSGIDGIVTDHPLRMRTALLRNGVNAE